MAQQQHNLQNNPWYRGYMPRSYTAPHKLASYGCSICLIAFGVFLLFAGTILTVISNVIKQQDDDPRFQSDFFKNARGQPNISNVMHTVGSVVLCLGGVFILFSVGLCCFAKCYTSKHDNEQRNLVTVSRNQQGGIYFPPTGSYPQQQPLQQPFPSGYPTQQYIPAPGSYPQQPVIASYPQQTVPPSAYPYPSEQPPPYEPYVSKNAPYPESRGPTTATAPPIG